MIFLDGRVRPAEPFGVNESSWQARGLVAWYPLVQPGSRTLLDLAGGCCNGILDATNPPKWRAAEGQAVLSFGESAVDEIALPQVLSTFTEATIWFWLRNQNNDGSGAPARMHNSGNANFSHYPFSNSETTFYSSWLNVSRAGPFDWSSRALNSNHWHGMAVRTFPGASGWQWWIRQELIGSQSGDSSVTVDAVDWILGRSFFSQPWRGQIAEFRVYNRALSQGEIMELNKPNARFELYKPLNPRIYGRTNATAGGGGSNNGNQIIICG